MIQHKGTIVHLEKNIAEITLQQTSACASCHAKGMCLSTDKQERKIFASINNPNDYFEGEEVNVSLKTQHGYKAVLLAYVIPVLIIVLSIVIFDQYHIKEWLSVLIALALLALYFIILKIFSVKITQSIEFQVEKINNDLKI